MSLAITMLLVCVAIYIAGQIGGAVLAVISNITTRTELPPGTSTLLATGMLALTTLLAISLSALKITGVPAMVTIAVVAFLVGVPVYALFVVDEDENRPISLGQAGLMSVAVTALLTGLAAAFLW